GGDCRSRSRWTPGGQRGPGVAGGPAGGGHNPCSRCRRDRGRPQNPHRSGRKPTLTRKDFGTDCIGGRVGEPPVTADFVLKLGWAAGKVFSEHFQGRKLILVGKDTRVSGYMFESALQAGLIAAGVNVGLLGPMPTPAIAYLTRTFRAQAGIVISASHNPFDDNGIKFFGGDGYKLADAIEHQIEDHLDYPLHTSISSELGRANRIADA